MKKHGKNLVFIFLLSAVLSVTGFLVDRDPGIQSRIMNLGEIAGMALLLFLLFSGIYLVAKFPGKSGRPLRTK